MHVLELDSRSPRTESPLPRSQPNNVPVEYASALPHGRHPVRLFVGSELQLGHGRVCPRGNGHAHSAASSHNAP